MTVYYIAILLFICLFQFYLLKRNNKDKMKLINQNLELNKIKEKYKGVINLEEEINNYIYERNEIIKKVDFEKNRAKTILEKIQILETNVAVLEEELSMQDFGVYRPKYYFEDLSEYKVALKNLSIKIKNLVKEKRAVVCHTNWLVGNSRREGEKMTNNFLKLLLRAFNSECDSAISKVKYNNIHVMESRINKAYDMLNQIASKSQNAEITSDYLQLRLNELYLTHEYHEKFEEEKEEQREIREQMREEEKVKKEYEKAQKEAEADEVRYKKALEKAEKEIKQAHGEQFEKLNQQIEILKKDLENAHQNKERAISMAQLTKVGHVYVVSNIGSFGENVYKIGMTRRIEPVDRVKELGNASVPFNFDIHAMIYSENAPDLESKIHKELENWKINKINNRREFFKVSLEHIQEIVEKLHGDIKITKLAEAEQYRKSLEIIKEQNKINLYEQNKSKELQEILSI